MADKIALLPDAIANQIAAGEVVQRPASILKELIENAVDAQASQIKVAIVNAGIGSVQVVDNGFGMSTLDARMSLERHATSKIKNANDLFQLNSYGFRGEALASIAAVAQIEIKTKREEDELGTHLIAEASKVKSQEFCQTPVGSIISVRNLFFNVPARRNFLKSHTVENKHLLEEFTRVALVNPHIAMEYSNNGKVIFNLAKDSFQGRVCALFNLNKDKDLIPVQEKTEVVSIDGFIAVPEKAKRTRGLQYFFANGRFIRDPYLQHSVFSCYENIIEKDKFAAFFINLTVASEKIDVNIHPTKTEVKFEDSRFIYTILQSVVKKALASRYTAPTPDLDPLFNINQDRERVPQVPTVKTNPHYSPFDSRPQKTKVPSKWENLYEPFRNEIKKEDVLPELSTQIEAHLGIDIYGLQQLHQRFILAQTSNGLFLIQQHHAHLRVLYDQFKQHQGRRSASQQLLFPVKIKLSGLGLQTLHDHLPYLNSLGFDIHLFNNQEVMVNAVPAQLSKTDITAVIERCVEAIQDEQNTDLEEKLLLSLSRNSAIKKHQPLDQNEMEHLAKALFEGENHAYTPDGKKILIPLDEQTIDSFF